MPLLDRCRPFCVGPMHYEDLCCLGVLMHILPSRCYQSSAGTPSLRIDTYINNDVCIQNNICTHTHHGHASGDQVLVGKSLSCACKRGWRPGKNSCYRMQLSEPDSQSQAGLTRKLLCHFAMHLKHFQDVDVLILADSALAWWKVGRKQSPVRRAV